MTFTDDEIDISAAVARNSNFTDADIAALCDSTGLPRPARAACDDGFNASVFVVMLNVPRLCIFCSVSLSLIECRLSKDPAKLWHVKLEWAKASLRRLASER